MRARGAIWLLTLLVMAGGCGRGGASSKTTGGVSDVGSPKWVAVSFWKAMYLAVDLGTAMQLTGEAGDTFSGKGDARQRQEWLREIDRRVQAIRTPKYEITEEKQPDGLIEYHITNAGGHPENVWVTVQQHPQFGWQVVNAGP